VVGFRGENGSPSEKSAAGAVFADSFVYKGVELGASERDFASFVFATITGFGELRATARRWSDVVARASGHKLGDFAIGEELRFAGEPGVESDFGEVLQSLHTEESSEQIRAAGDSSVIGQEQGVIVRNIRFKDGAQVRRAGSGVTNERDFSERDNNFGKKSLIQALARGRKTRGHRGMSMTDGLNVRAHAIEEEVHTGLGGDSAIALEVVAFHIHDDEIFGRHHALADASGGGKNALGIEAKRNISLTGNNVAALIHPAADETNVPTVLFFGSNPSFRRRVRRHGADSFFDLERSGIK
jgi:hypothetical protein